MLTPLYKITPAGDGQLNLNIQGISTISYEMTFDGSKWNARRGSQEMVFLANASPNSGVNYTALITNYNSSRGFLIFKHNYGANVNFALLGVSPADSTEYFVLGTDDTNVTAPSFSVGSTGTTSRGISYQNIPKSFKLRYIVPAVAGSMSLSFCLSGY